MTELQDILDAWNSPPMRHAMMGHLPIVLTMLGLPLALASALLPKKRVARWLAIAAYALMGIMAWVTLSSGEAAEAAINRALPTNVHEIIEEHEEMADKLWLFGFGVAALLAVSAVPRPLIRSVASVLAVLGGFVALAWVSVTAHLGGTLVYTHGVGTGAAARSEVSAAQTDGDAGAEVASREHVSDAGAQPSDAGAGPQGATEAQLAFFRAEVAPILTTRCLNCHNPMRARRSGRLDQTTRETLLAGGRSGPAIVPGDPEASLLIHRVRGDDLDEDPMPPPPRERLTAAEIAALEQWIRDGAAWDAEAMRPPTSPSPVPNGS